MWFVSGSGGKSIDSPVFISRGFVFSLCTKHRGYKQCLMRSLLFVFTFLAFASVSFASSENLSWPVKDPENLRLKKLISLDHENLPVSGKDVVVAVIDTGASAITKPLAKHLVPGWNFIDDNASTMDLDGHGTPVAGIVTLIAPSVKIMPLLVIKEYGSQDDIVDATVYAIKHNVPVINLSVTFTEEMLRRVRDTVGAESFKKSLLVLASGNSGERYPSLQERWPNVIVVGTIGLDLPIHSTSYSVYGPDVDIAAPSGDAEDGIATYSPFSTSLHPFNGTSGAAPVVAGAAALLKEKFPKAQGADLKKMLITKTCHSKEINVFEGRLLNIGRLFDKAYKCF